YLIYFFFIINILPNSTLFPYTTLFRSEILLAHLFFEGSKTLDVLDSFARGLLTKRVWTPEPLNEHAVCHVDAVTDRNLRYVVGRSEEHTSELQSRENLVCRLLLEIKKE